MTVEIGSGINNIGKNAFAYCESLTEFISLGNVSVISEAMFIEDTNLTVVDILQLKLLKMLHSLDV